MCNNLTNCYLIGKSFSLIRKGFAKREKSTQFLYYLSWNAPLPQISSNHQRYVCNPWSRLWLSSCRWREALLANLTHSPLGEQMQLLALENVTNLCYTLISRELAGWIEETYYPQLKSIHSTETWPQMIQPKVVDEYEMNLGTHALVQYTNFWQFLVNQVTAYRHFSTNWKGAHVHTQCCRYLGKGCFSKLH